MNRAQILKLLQLQLMKFRGVFHSFPESFVVDWLNVLSLKLLLQKNLNFRPSTLLLYNIFVQTLSSRLIALRLCHYIYHLRNKLNLVIILSLIKSARPRSGLFGLPHFFINVILIIFHKNILTHLLLPTHHRLLETHLTFFEHFNFLKKFCFILKLFEMSVPHSLLLLLFQLLSINDFRVLTFILLKQALDFSALVHLARFGHVWEPPRRNRCLISYLHRFLPERSPIG